MGGAFGLRVFLCGSEESGARSRLYVKKNQEISRPRPLNIATIKFAVGLECVLKYVNECSHFRPRALASAFTEIRTILPRTPAFV